MNLPFFTVGHSNLSLDAFVDMLHGPDVQRLVDIRTIARSRANPQFNEDALSQSLPAQDITYERLAALGGLRGKSRHLPPEINGFWSNTSFHNYADYATTPAFRAGLDQLIAEGRDQRCAIMCAESVWWRCHRRIVSDHLIARGERVFHIMGAGRVVPATLTPGAMVRPDGSVIYPIPNN